MTQPATPRDTAVAYAGSGAVLLNLILILLTPLFLADADGDLVLARTAAYETVVAYRVQHHISLVKVARAIAFGLAALDSLSLSMREDLAITLILRLRGNANALNRSAERAEQALAETPCVAAEPPKPIDEAAMLAGVAEAQARAAAARARLQDQEKSPQPAPQPALEAVPHLAPEPTPVPQLALRPAFAPIATPEQQNRAMWGAAMADVAGEFAAEAAHLPPAERRVAALRAQILSTAANHLLCGTEPPQQPGDLPGMRPPPGR